MFSPAAHPSIEKQSYPAAGVTDIRKARLVLEQETRTAILLKAADLLLLEGPSALTVRRVAEAVNASTKIVYTHFGGKDGLLDALYLHSFAGLEAAMRLGAEHEDPPAALLGMCLAYRTYGVENPALYNIMFGDLGRAYRAPDASRRQASETFRILRRAIEYCLPPRSGRDTSGVTRLLWAAMHGVVSLDSRGLLGNPAEIEPLYRQAIEAVLVSHHILPNPIPGAQP